LFLNFSKLYSLGESFFGSSIISLLAVYAFIHIAYNVISGLYNFYLKFLAPQINLVQRYGHKSWVLITGGAEGIGRGFAREFAKWGFNLVILDYQEQLLAKTCDELRQAYPHISVKQIVCDFRKSHEPGFFDDIQSQIEGLDISILVNNVGACLIKPFLENEYQEMKDMMIINMFPLTFLTRNLLPQMIKRTKRSAVITISSEESIIRLPKFVLYGVTKAFSHHFSRSLINEIGDKADFLSIHPGLVSTRLTKFVSVGYDSITPEECARGSLSALGRRKEAYGGWRHEIWNALANKFDIFGGLYMTDLELRFRSAEKRNKELGINL